MNLPLGRHVQPEQCWALAYDLAALEGTRGGGNVQDLIDEMRLPLTDVTVPPKAVSLRCVDSLMVAVETVQWILSGQVCVGQPGA